MMIELITSYSLSDILVFGICLAIAFKSLIVFIDWLKQEDDKRFSLRSSKEKRISNIEQRLNADDDKLLELKQGQEETNQNIAEIKQAIDLLVNSDKEDIKSFIVQEHHKFCYSQKWIDDYSLDCIEKRFDCYRKEHGNSYVESLMKELRALPKVELVEDKKEK